MTNPTETNVGACPNWCEASRPAHEWMPTSEDVAFRVHQRDLGRFSYRDDEFSHDDTPEAVVSIVSCEDQDSPSGRSITRDPLIQIFGNSLTVESTRQLVIMLTTAIETVGGRR